VAKEAEVFRNLMMIFLQNDALVAEVPWKAAGLAKKNLIQQRRVRRKK
jgi:hypothetical protein